MIILRCTVEKTKGQVFKWLLKCLNDCTAVSDKARVKFDASSLLFYSLLPGMSKAT